MAIRIPEEIECLTPQTFNEIDPYHPNIGVTTINELVQDLRRHEDHLGAERSIILGTIEADISGLLIGETKRILINTLEEIGIILLVLVRTEVEERKWCDPDGTAYTGADTISNWPDALNNHWEWKTIIEDLRTILQELLCTCLNTQPQLGQEIWMTLIPNSVNQPIRSRMGVPNTPYPNQNQDEAWANFQFAPSICDKTYIFWTTLDHRVSLEAVKDGFIADCVNGAGCEFSSPRPCYGFKYDIPNEMREYRRYIWAAEALNVNDVDGIVDSEQDVTGGTRVGDIIEHVHAVWIRPAFFWQLNRGRDWEFDDVKFTVKLNEVEIWSGTFTHLDCIEPSDFEDGILPGRRANTFYALDPTGHDQDKDLVPLETLNLQGKELVEIIITPEDSSKPPDSAFEGKKALGMHYGRQSSGVIRYGLITIKIVRPVPNIIAINDFTVNSGELVLIEPELALNAQGVPPIEWSLSVFDPDPDMTISDFNFDTTTGVLSFIPTVSDSLPSIQIIFLARGANLKFDIEEVNVGVTPE